jgi:hypothetical protein
MNLLAISMNINVQDCQRIHRPLVMPHRLEMLMRLYVDILAFGASYSLGTIRVMVSNRELLVLFCTSRYSCIYEAQRIKMPRSAFFLDHLKIPISFAAFEHVLNF